MPQPELLRSQGTGISHIGLPLSVRELRERSRRPGGGGGLPALWAPPCSGHCSAVAVPPGALGKAGLAVTVPSVWEGRGQQSREMLPGAVDENQPVAVGVREQVLPSRRRFCFWWDSMWVVGRGWFVLGWSHTYRLRPSAQDVG